MAQSLHVVDSLYLFSHPEELAERFLSSEIGKNCRCTYDNEKYVLECSQEAGDTMIEAFLSMYRDYIETEKATKPEIFEVPKIIRREGTVVFSSMSQLYEQIAQTNQGNGTENHSQAIPSGIADTNQLLFPHETFSKTINISQSCSSQVLAKIGIITGCALQMKTGGRQIFMKGDTETALNRAFAKINVIIAKAERANSTNFHVDLCIYEDEDLFRIRLQVPLSVIDRRVKQVMKDVDTQLFEMKMVKWNTYSSKYDEKANTSTKIQPQSQAATLWSGFEYPSLATAPSIVNHLSTSVRAPMASSPTTVPFPNKGPVPSQSQNLLSDDEVSTYGSSTIARDEIKSAADSSAISNRDPVTAWTEQVPAEVANPFLATVTEDEANNLIELSPSKTGYIRAKRVLKKPPASAAAISGISTSPTEIGPPPIRPPKMPNPLTVPESEIADNPTKWNSEVVRTVAVGSLLDRSQAAQNRTPETNSSSPFIQRSTPKAKAAPSQQVLQDSPWAKATELIQQDDRKQLRLLDTRDVTKTELLIEAIPEQLVDVSEPEDQKEVVKKLTEVLQSTSERDTRQYRKTPSLLKSSTDLELSPSVPDLQIANTLQEILDFSRSCYGMIKLQICLGRFYVKQDLLRDEMKRQPFLLREWSSIFATTTTCDVKKPVMVFGKALTLHQHEAEFLLDLKQTGDRRMFERLPVDIEVLYEIHCTNRKTKSQTIVELDLALDVSFRAITEIIGTVNCHFPGRVWNASFTVSETPGIEVSLQDPIRNMVKDLWVKGGEFPTIGAEGNSVEIEVNSVVVKRTSTHKSTVNPAFLLHITEVQDLELQDYSGQQFFATAVPRNASQPKDCAWWEASITSEPINTVLANNQDLEFGEVAEWKPKQLVRAVPALFDLVKNVVTRIDAVGMTNERVSTPPKSSISGTTSSVRGSAQGAPIGNRSVAKASQSGRSKKEPIWQDW